MEDVRVNYPYQLKHQTNKSYRADQELGTLLEVLEGNRDIVVVENAELLEDDDKPPPPPAAGEKTKVPGSVVSIVERLDDELTRSLQHIDPHTAEYIERLSDEQALYNKVVRAMLYVEEIQKDPKLEVPKENANRIVMRRVEHIYFKVKSLVTDLVILLTLLSLRR
jgi:translation initiation factor 3 subunit C